MTSISCANYFLTILDDHSRSIWTFLMKNKSEFSGLLVEFFKFVETRFQRNIKTIRTDNGGNSLTVI